MYLYTFPRSVLLANLHSHRHDAVAQRAKWQPPRGSAVTHYKRLSLPDGWPDHEIATAQFNGGKAMNDVRAGDSLRARTAILDKSFGIFFIQTPPSYARTPACHAGPYRRGGKAGQLVNGRPSSERG
ncbi:hypothetical protein [Sphingopyxis sp. LC81]|uniref:hypothetical protein n=1 Tax=Sphingopyxis sp. LC81 TaxID=1502850 RepID=UPI00126A203D|nr:hypothetical protein [Sphingopyxis sp. LC81]